MKKLTLNKILNPGLENDETGLPVDGAGEGAPAVAAEEPTEEELLEQEEQDLAAEEVPADEAAIDSDMGDIERLEETEESLESIAGLIEQSLPEGGLTPAAAQFMRASVESLMKPLGEDTPVASVESFGGFSERLVASQEALEGLKEGLKKIWEAIKAMVQKVWVAVRDFFKKIFTAAGRLKTSAEKLKAKAEEYKDSAAGQISVGGKGRKVAIGAKVDIANLDKLIQVAEDSIKFDAATDARLVKDVEAIRKLATQPIEDTDEALEAAMKASFSLGEKVAPAAFRNKQDDGKKLVWSTDVLPGNVRFSLAYDNHEAVEGKVASIVTKYFKSWRVEKQDMKKEGTEVQEIKVFSKAEILKVAAAALRICQISENASKQAGYDKLTFKDMEFGKDVSKTQQAAVKLLVRDYGKRMAMSQQLSAKVAAYAVSTAGAFVDLGYRSLAAAGKGQKTDDKK